MLAQIWTFLADPENRTIVAWIFGGLMTAIGGLWTVFKYFNDKKQTTGKADSNLKVSSENVNVRADRGGMAAGRNLNVRNHITINSDRFSKRALLLVLVGFLVLGYAGLNSNRAILIQITHFFGWYSLGHELGHGLRPGEADSDNFFVTDFSKESFESFLEDVSSAYTIEQSNLRTSSIRAYVRTKKSNYLSIDFVASLTYTQYGGGGPGGIFFGIGSSQNNPNFYNEPSQSIFFLDFANDFAFKGISVRRWIENGSRIKEEDRFTSEPESFEGLAKVQIEKVGNTLTFKADLRFDGLDFKPHFSESIDLYTEASFLDDTNSHVFFGTGRSGSVFHELVLRSLDQQKQAEVEPIGHPSYPVGTEWVWKAGTGETFSDRVIESNGTQVVLKRNTDGCIHTDNTDSDAGGALGRRNFYRGCAWGTGSSQVVQHSGALFPLRIGARETSTTINEQNGIARKIECSVTGREIIAVPAGTFDSYRVFCKEPGFLVERYYSVKHGTRVQYRRTHLSNGYVRFLQLVSFKPG